MNETQADPVMLARAERGLTQAALAVKAKVRHATISEIERGMKRPRAKTLAKLAKALRVNLGDLLAHYQQHQQPGAAK